MSILRKTFQAYLFIFLIIIMSFLPVKVFASVNSLFCEIGGAKGVVIKIIMGDPSGDGHSMVKENFICANISYQKILDAYKSAVAVIGFDYVDVVATEYDEPSITKEHLNKLRDAGLLIVIEDEEYSVNDNYVSIHQEEYFNIWLQLVKLGNSQFNYQSIRSQQVIDIGGYGLFSF